MATIQDEKITAYVSGHPWLKIVLTVMMALLGAAKGRAWFGRRYGI